MGSGLSALHGGLLQPAVLLLEASMPSQLFDDLKLPCACGLMNMRIVWIEDASRVKTEGMAVERVRHFGN